MSVGNHVVHLLLGNGFLNLLDADFDFLSGKEIK